MEQQVTIYIPEGVFLKMVEMIPETLKYLVPLGRDASAVCYRGRG